MKFPNIQYADTYRQRKQTGFGGVNLRRGAGDGEIADMMNMTSAEYPLLASRRKREKRLLVQEPQGIYYWGAFCRCSGGKFYFDGVERGTVSEGEKTMCGIGNYIVIMPDKKYYNVTNRDFGSMESEWTGEQVLFTNGKLFDEDAEANCIQADGVTWSEYFKAGDAVTISGCTQHEENNKTPIIREIDGDKLYFYENVFVLEGENGLTPYSEGGGISIKRAVPDMDYLCENDNRLWGCRKNEIYACALGDIFNWNKFDGLATDSYACDVGSRGYFTGCFTYGGYPTFFKEQHIYRMYGNYPSNYQLMGSATTGLMSGCSKSLAIAGEKLFYMSRSGIVAYTGGIPASVSEAFGTNRYKDAVAGSDGGKYYVSMKDENNRSRLFVYDTDYGTWHIEDDVAAKGFCASGRRLWMMDGDGQLWLIGNSEYLDAAMEDTVPWMVETADFTDREPEEKHQSTVTIRLELERESSARVFIQYDSCGYWRPVGKTVHASAKKSIDVPVITRRCDHYRLKLAGEGTVRIYSITREDELCADLKSVKT